ncbi:DUF1648 domain-containing protein [Actinoplanes solisilvae]|uniref:DUF1648 domain-containing protein n=1 Tax=Actinoplanes solisilvae TaxID=2486853 RepID=UPI000FD88131|nr:DUF1648 domain-containing protein [Actinoplanes solisilvae]
MTRSRIWAALILIWLPLAVTAFTWAAWSDRLPDRLPTHWSGTGPADGFSDATGFAVAILAVGVAAGVAALFVPRTRYLLAACGAVAGGAAGVWLAAASTDPVDTRLGWRFLWLVAGIGWAAVVAVVAGPQPGGHTPPPVTVTPLDLSPTERAAWSTTQRAPLLLTISVIAALVIAVVAAAGPVEIWPVLAVPVLTGLVFGRVRVTVDRRGVRLVAGLLDIPFKTVPLKDIVRADATEINPLEWGGWGYRITPGRSALVLRKGPGLVLYLTNGHLLAITMDDPRTPAALLGALVSG